WSSPDRAAARGVAFELVLRLGLADLAEEGDVANSPVVVVAGYLLKRAITDRQPPVQDLAQGRRHRVGPLAGLALLGVGGRHGDHRWDAIEDELAIDQRRQVDAPVGRHLDPGCRVDAVPWVAEDQGDRGHAEAVGFDRGPALAVRD